MQYPISLHTLLNLSISLCTNYSLLLCTHYSISLCTNYSIPLCTGLLNLAVHILLNPAVHKLLNLAVHKLLNLAVHKSLNLSIYLSRCTNYSIRFLIFIIIIISLYSALLPRTSQLQGRNGFTYRNDHQGIYVLPSSRGYRDVIGRTFYIQFEIVDNRVYTEGTQAPFYKVQVNCNQNNYNK